MRQKIWLVCERNKIVRLAKRSPSLFRNQIALGLTITIPEDHFRSLVINMDIEPPASHFKPSGLITLETEPANP